MAILDLLITRSAFLGGVLAWIQGAADKECGRLFRGVADRRAMSDSEALHAKDAERLAEIAVDAIIEATRKNLDSAKLTSY